MAVYVTSGICDEGSGFLGALFPKSMEPFGLSKI